MARAKRKTARFIPNKLQICGGPDVDPGSRSVTHWRQALDGGHAAAVGPLLSGSGKAPPAPAPTKKFHSHPQCTCPATTRPREARPEPSDSRRAKASVRVRRGASTDESGRRRRRAGRRCLGALRVLNTVFPEGLIPPLQKRSLGPLPPTPTHNGLASESAGRAASAPRRLPPALPRRATM